MLGRAAGRAAGTLIVVVVVAERARMFAEAFVERLARGDEFCQPALLVLLGQRHDVLAEIFHRLVHLLLRGGEMIEDFADRRVLMVRDDLAVEMIARVGKMALRIGELFLVLLAHVLGRITGLLVRVRLLHHRGLLGDLLVELLEQIGAVARRHLRLCRRRYA